MKPIKPMDLAKMGELARGLDALDMPGTAEMMRGATEEIEALRERLAYYVEALKDEQREHRQTARDGARDAR